MNKIKFKIIITLLIVIFSVSVISLDSKESIVANSKSVSDQKIGWGIKRNSNNEQPDLGAENKKLINKYEGYCLGNSETKKIYLTFDEGYEAGYTEKTLF